MYLAAEAGVYNVGLLAFRRDERGLACLHWWRDRCLEWCFTRFEDGKFGDQKYLDDWSTRFRGIHELRHLGGGVAPWNVQQYDFSVTAGRLRGRVRGQADSWPVVFYHFHSFCLLSPRAYFPVRGYDLAPEPQALIYEPYFRALQDCVRSVGEFAPAFNFGYKTVSLKEKLASRLSRFGSMKLLIRFYKLIRDKIYGQKDKS